MSKSKRTRRAKNLRKRNMVNVRAPWSHMWSQLGLRQPQGRGRRETEELWS